MKLKINPLQGVLDKDNLLEQGKLELEKLKGLFDDARTVTERILAIQWLLDQTEKAEPLPLLEMLSEETEFFDSCIRTLDGGPGEEYEDLTQYSFIEQVQLDFCREYLEKCFSGKGAKDQ
jgi:hypothetical protein